MGTEVPLLPSPKLTVRPWKWGPPGKGNFYSNPTKMIKQVSFVCHLHVIFLRSDLAKNTFKHRSSTTFLSSYHHQTSNHIQNRTNDTNTIWPNTFFTFCLGSVFPPNMCFSKIKHQFSSCFFQVMVMFFGWMWSYHQATFLKLLER